MVATDNLFRLIKALDMNEKRYFRLFASLHHKSKHHMELFDLIDKQKVYDEGHLRKSIKNKMLLKQLAFYKNYLYNQLLKCLRFYHSSKTKTQQVRELIDNAFILTEKSQFDESLRLLKKAKVMAEKSELFLYIMEVESIESGIRRKIQDIDWLSSHTNKDSEEVYIKFKNEQEFNVLKSTFFVQLNKIGKATNANTLKKYKALKRNSLLRTEKNALSNTALMHYYDLNGLYYNIIGDSQKSMEQFGKLKNHLEEKMNVKEDHKDYFPTLMNVLLSSYKHIKIEKAIEILKEIEKIKPSSPDNAREMKASYFVNLMRINLYHKNTEAYKKIIAEVQGWIHNTNMDRVTKNKIVLLYFNLSNLCFWSNDLKRAMHWLLKILNDNDSQSIQFLYCYSRIFNLIIHVELGNDDLLPYLTKSTYRYLVKREQLNKFELCILGFIRKRILQKDAKISRKVLSEFREELKEIFKDPLEAVVLDYFDIIGWLNSRIQTNH